MQYICVQTVFHHYNRQLGGKRLKLRELHQLEAGVMNRESVSFWIHMSAQYEKKDKNKVMFMAC